MGLSLLADSGFECAVKLLPHLLELHCEGDLELQFQAIFESEKMPGYKPGYYELRGGEINTSREPWGSTHTPLFLVLN